MVKRNNKELVDEIRTTVAQLKEGVYPNQQLIHKLFELYSVYYNETQTNYDCGVCMARIITRLKTI